LTSSSTSSRLRRAIVLLAGALAVLLALPPAASFGAAAAERGPRQPTALEPIALLPFDNLTGNPVQLAPLQERMRAALEGAGLSLLDDDALEDFLAKHRVRWTGGLSQETSEALARETGARTALVTALVAEDPASPPRLALAYRLVEIGAAPRTLLMEDHAQAGDEAPGFLSLGLVEDPEVLDERAADRLATSLAARLDAPAEVRSSRDADRPAKRFRPQRSYRSPHLDFASGPPPRVAVLPFVDESGRRRAGDVVSLMIVRRIRESSRVDLIEPGMVRETLLESRLIMEGDVSLPQVEVLHGFLQADLVVTGTVTEFEEFAGRNGSPVVEFSVRVIDARTRQAVWSSISYNQGEDGVFFFGCGRVRSASALVSEMARGVVAGFLGER
jgi:TolB-like protein